MMSEVTDLFPVFLFLQISGCLSAQAQVKLQLLNAELRVFDLSLRYSYTPSSCCRTHKHTEHM